MYYAKPPLTFDEQADLLLQRGLLADRNMLLARSRASVCARCSPTSTRQPQLHE